MSRLTVFYILAAGFLLLSARSEDAKDLETGFLRANINNLTRLSGALSQFGVMDPCQGLEINEILPHPSIQPEPYKDDFQCEFEDKDKFTKIRGGIANDNLAMGLINSGDDFGWTHGWVLEFGDPLSMRDKTNIKISNNLYTKPTSDSVNTSLLSGRPLQQDTQEIFQVEALYRVPLDKLAYYKLGAIGGVNSINEKGEGIMSTRVQQEMWHRQLGIQVYENNTKGSSNITFGGLTGAIGILFPGSKGKCRARDKSGFRGMVEFGVTVHSEVEGNQFHLKFILDHGTDLDGITLRPKISFTQEVAIHNQNQDRNIYEIGLDIEHTSLFYGFSLLKYTGEPPPGFVQFSDSINQSGRSALKNQAKEDPIMIISIGRLF